jgi:chromosome segregation protein
MKWVLGEQSVKALRGTRMDDVIFSGTKDRRGLGLAEVTMVFDNSDQIFPLAFNEVAVTRRVFKSGESDYYLNQNKCRLKDIQDLFLDTGVGKDAYSFVGQGRIDEILSARPEERRALLEEVAGIAKYKARKRETTNKLADTEAALTRVRDLLFELENQMEPLQLEAEQAQRYLRLQAERQSVEKNLILYELNMAERRRQRDQRSRQQVNDQIIEAQKQLLRLEAWEERCRLEQTALQERLQATNQLLHQLAQQGERLLGQRGIILNREEERQRQLADLAIRQATLDARRAELSQQMEEAAASKEQLQRAIVAKMDELQALQAALRLAEQQGSDVLLQQTEQQLAEQSQLYQAAELEVSLWRDRQERLDNELQSLEQDLLGAEARCQQLSQQLTALTEREQQTAGRCQDLQSEQACLEAERQQAEAALAASKRQGQQIQQELAAVASRLRLLRDMMDHMEGYQRGVRALMLAKKRGEESLSGLIGVMGDLLNVPGKYEYAIEVALGGSLQFVVTETESDAKRGIAYLKRNDAGRATFLPLDVIQPRARRAVEQAAANMPGALGFAVDLVSFQPDVRKVMENFLGNILVVESLEQAVQIAKATGHQVRMVTLEGDLLAPGGSISGGSRQRRGGGFLGRQRELQRLTAERQRLQESGQSNEQAITANEAHLAALVERLRGVASQLRQLESQRLQLQGELHSGQRMLSQHQQATQELRQRCAETRQRLGHCQQELLAAKEQVAATSLALAGTKQNLERLRAADAEQSKQRLADLERAHRLEVALSSLQEQLQGQQRFWDSLAERVAEEASSLKQVAAEQQRLQIAGADDQGQLLQLEQEMQRLQLQQQQQSSELEQTKQSLEALQADSSTSRQQIRQQRDLVEEQKNNLYSIELRLSRLESECETMRARLETDYQVADLQNEHSTLQSRTQGEELLASVKQQIADLGPVRVSAIAELERLQERVGFLNTQQQDLVDSRQSLEQIIQEIDQLIARRFLDAFQEVRRVFQKTFAELFDGGEADLRLVNADQPLETGIDILAQPPGKNLQNINLLSGGEKALTAVALLCAVLQVKPTPFCILDEIDAPLDDANIRRLMQVVKRLAEETQFVMITHSKETMLAADTLYGVTMPARGVSQVISVKLSEAGNN